MNEVEQHIEELVLVGLDDVGYFSKRILDEPNILLLHLFIIMDTRPTPTIHNFMNLNKLLKTLKS